MCMLAAVTSLSADAVPTLASQHSDTFLQSPSILASAVTLASLREFFDVNNYANTQQKARNKDVLYSQAMSLFIKNVYNGPNYARHLSQDARHITEFLNIANEFGFSCEQLYTGLRIFYNKYKETQLIDDTVLNHILEALPQELEAYFPLQADPGSRPQRSPSKVVENIILSELTDHIVAPQKPNDLFFQNLAENIASTIKSGPEVNDEAAMREQLRQLTIRFIEQITGKTMWYANQPASIWQSILGAAHSIHTLCHKRIIEDLDSRDDLFRTLVARFAYFLDEYGAQLPLSFYEQVTYDINKRQVFFLEEAELDQGIQSKKEFLLKALARAHAKATATHKHGAVSA